RRDEEGDAAEEVPEDGDARGQRDDQEERVSRPMRPAQAPPVLRDDRPDDRRQEPYAGADELERFGLGHDARRLLPPGASAKESGRTWGTPQRRRRVFRSAYPADSGYSAATTATQSAYTAASPTPNPAG